MAVEPLSDDLIAAGNAMTAELDRIGLEPQGVLWLHWHDLNDWRFTVVSDMVEQIGRLKVYTLIDKALNKIGPVAGMTIVDIHLAASTELISYFLRHIAPPIVEHVTFTDCDFDGVKVDAYIYRSMPPREHKLIMAGARRFAREVEIL